MIFEDGLGLHFPLHYHWMAPLVLQMFFTPWCTDTFCPTLEATTTQTQVSILVQSFETFFLLCDMVGTILNFLYSSLFFCCSVLFTTHSFFFLFLIKYCLVTDLLLSFDAGYFTAPVRGVYYFSFTSFWWGANPGSCGGSLYKNGNKVVSWYVTNSNHASSGSNSAVLQLQVGDNVNVRLWNNRRISDNGNKYSSFSGFLLFPV